MAILWPVSFLLFNKLVIMILTKGEYYCIIHTLIVQNLYTYYYYCKDSSVFYLYECKVTQFISKKEFSDSPLCGYNNSYTQNQKHHI